MISTQTSFGTAAQLSDYTAAVLAQMTHVIESYVGQRADDYASHVGAHMRHIIEHYDALANALKAVQTGFMVLCTADYDARERDQQLESDPLEAMRRIAGVAAVFCPDAGLTESAINQCVEVHTRGGMKGEHNFCTPSTLARELIFLNSHATHHFAILQGSARERGQSLGAGVGKAPATVAHELRLNQNKVAA
jgi:hypothetical protein